MAAPEQGGDEGGRTAVVQKGVWPALAHADVAGTLAPRHRLLHLVGTNPRSTKMIDTKTIEEMAKRFAADLPESARNVQADIERNFKAVLGGAFQRLDLVTREEHEVLREIVERMHERLEGLTARVAELERPPEGDAGQ